MIKTNILIFSIVLILVIAPLIIAETETYKIDQETNLRFTCTLNEAIPTGASYNITISYPNGTLFIDNQATTAQGSGAFNYTTTFTDTGLYKVQNFCYDGTYSYSSTGYYDITGNGKTAPNENIILFFSIAILILLGFGLYSLILSMGHFASLDLDVVDVAKSFGVYFAILGLYQLSLIYLGSPQIETWLILFIKIGAWTHILIPLVGFVISITIGGLKKKKMDWGTQRIYKRSKIG